MNHGQDKLWEWFGLSYASFIVVPRVLAHEMPDEWQRKMADLLEQYDATFPEWPEGMGCIVQVTQDGKLAKTPEWLKNYRHPDIREIEKVRGRGEVLMEAQDGQ